jgi:hypothetical protein
VVLRRKLAGVARSRAPVHGFERGKALHGARDTGDSTTGSRRRLWLRVNDATAGGGWGTSRTTATTLASQIREEEEEVASLP